MKKLSIWHDGERAIQESIGVAKQMEVVGQRVVRDFMPDQHREFFAQLPFILLGSVDDSGHAWATVLEGRPGFMRSGTPTTLDIRAHRDPRDPATPGIGEGKPIGLLGIELHTRRRNRVNGIVRAASTDEFRFEVDQSFGNCPQYIQLRDYEFSRDPLSPSNETVTESADLDDAARAMIAAADTFFVASYADREDRRQVDVSHRGGKAGFVRIADDGTLTIPDFAGNLFFATLGNILLNGRAGLVFLDFETGDVLQLTGEASVILDSPEIAAFQGAERLWSFRAQRVVLRRSALALRWVFEKDGWSPNALMTGSWSQAADRLRATELATRWRPFRVTKVFDESETIRSFHLLPDDGAGLVPHEAGQHLPIRVTVPGTEKPVIRTYTLSVAPSDSVYRISVKREGLVSGHLHDNIHVGDMIEVRVPEGVFVIDPHEKRTAVLLAGGVGITPLLAMLRYIVYEGLRTRGIRPTWLFQAAHSKKDRPFDRELADLVDAGQGVVRVVRVLGDPEGAKEGVDYDAAGRINMALLKRFLPFDHYDFYICGPSPFTQALYDGLRSYDIPDARIHAEAFGPSALKRLVEEGAASEAGRPPSDTSVPVGFMKSLKEARWTPESGTLLDLAEARGLNPEFSCRVGTCGTCRTRLLKGAVTYVKEPTAPVGPDQVLICCAVPARQETPDEDRIQLDL